MPGCMSPERQKWMVHHMSPAEVLSMALPVASVKFEGYSQHKTLEVPYFLLGETCL